MNPLILENDMKTSRGVSRESLYKALGENGNPSFATVLKVARALGMRLHVAPA
jgi:probable addiction module antidote protein